MEKDSLVCFRVSRDLQESLVTISLEERRSLSSIIEIVLTTFLQMRKMVKEANIERRSHRRKTILAPALIKQYSPGGTKLDTAVITDISLGGMQITIPKDTKHEISVAPQKSRFEVVFTLPDDNKPIYMTCEPRRFVDSRESIRVGASFTDDVSQSYKTLQTYLM
jgi:hypothetical protein